MTSPENIRRNLQSEPTEVRHKKLKRFGDSMFKSVCPKCPDGMLPMQRNVGTWTLKTEDCCISCGARFKYVDVVEDSVVLEYKEEKQELVTTDDE